MTGCADAIVMHIDRYRNADAALMLYGGLLKRKGQSVILVWNMKNSLVVIMCKPSFERFVKTETVGHFFDFRFFGS